MTPNEAYKIFKKKCPKREAIVCFDFGDYYLFGTLTEDSKEYKGPEMDSEYIVNKDTGEVLVYNPLKINIKASKKRVPVFR